MKPTAPAPPLTRRRAPQTLTLDMDLPPVPVKRTRTSSVPQTPAAVLPVAVPLAAQAKTVSQQAKPSAQKTAARTAAPVVVKPKISGKTKISTSVPDSARVEREMALEGGRLWRMSGRHAVAYVHNASLACALLAVETKHLARHAMAVYYDKKGRAIAWQVRFDTQHWDDVMRQLG